MKKTLLKFISLILLASLLSGFVTAVSFAAPADPGITRLDISDGIIYGKNVNYNLILPKFWINLVEAERVNLGPQSGDLLDQINFYCKSVSGKNPRALLIIFRVFTAKNWNDSTAAGLSVVSKTQSYVFTIKYNNAANPFPAGSQDMSSFSAVIGSINLVTDFKKLLTLPPGQKETYSNTVFINNRYVSDKSVIINGVCYVPLRDVAEAMGYTVTWNANAHSVTVAKNGNFKDVLTLYPKTTEDSRKILMRIIIDRTYVELKYITRILKKSLTYDNKGNVYITN